MTTMVTVPGDRHRRAASFGCAAALVIASLGTAHANTVTFNAVGGGPWGGPFGEFPDDLIFVEDAIPVRVQNYHAAGSTAFDIASIEPAFGTFGSVRVLRTSRIDVEFDFTHTPSGACGVRFDYLDFCCGVNLRVNDGPIHEPVAFSALNGVAVAPGVLASVVWDTSGGSEQGVVTLTGPVETLWVGGLEIFVDDVEQMCVVSAPDASDGLPGPNLSPLANPFRAGASFDVFVSGSGLVTLDVFDVSGSRVATLLDGILPAGSHRVAWSGVDRAGRSLPSGTYFVRLEADGGVASTRVVLMP